MNVLSRVSKSSSICCGVVVDIDLSETKQAERKPSQAGPSLAHGRLAGTVLTSRLLAPGSVSNIYLLFVSVMGSDVGGVGLHTMGSCCVLC